MLKPRWGQDLNRDSVSCLRCMPDTTLPKAPGTAVLQDCYGNHCRKTVAHVMVLWKYKPLDPNDAF
jgi:hypothetical protein